MLLNLIDLVETFFFILERNIAFMTKIDNIF